MNNPYQQQSNDESGIYRSADSGLQVSSNAQGFLYSSKGWVRFVSVLFFIAFAVMVVLSISVMSTFGRVGGAGIGILTFLLMAVMSVVTFMLGLRLSKFASAIGRLELSRQPVELEIAMTEQMKFWRLCGILVIIWLLLTLVMLVSG